MHCENCDYPLWNLKARQCPECGTPFLPSEFEFVINSVQFCCPHCEQVYYGTGAKGHLVPAQFDCVKCGRRLSMDEMLLRPAAGLEEEQTRVGHVPWLERAKRGRLKAWLATMGMALVRPGALMAALPVHSPSLQAWWFAILTSIVAYLGAILPLFLLMFALVPVSGGGGGPPAGMMAAIFAGTLAAGLVGGVLFTILFVLITGAICHGILKLTGPTYGSLGRTYQAFCYSSGANITTAIPFCGRYIGPVWWLVSAVLAVKEGQKVHGGRATAGVLISAAVTFIASIGIYLWFFASILFFGAGGARMSAVGTPSMPETALLTRQVLIYAEAHGGGRGPDHALQLVTAGGVGTGSLIAADFATTQESIPVGDGSLLDFQLFGPNRQQEIAAQMAEALPDNVIAHRVGDFVFTYHGIDLSAAPGGLWIVVLSPDPDSNPADAAGTMLVRGFDNGSTIPLPRGSLPIVLETQNELRATFGLPPLPDPATVTHAQPAVEPDTDEGE